MMDGDVVIRIERETLRFRRAIERCDTRRLPITMADFPSGACGDAALLLAKHLQLAGIWPLIYVCGEMAMGRRNQSHAWLEYGDLIIDITADQFEDISDPVIVTTDRAWHGRFTVTLRAEADYNNWTGIDPLPNAFKAISSYIETV